MDKYASLESYSSFEKPKLERYSSLHIKVTRLLQLILYNPNSSYEVDMKKYLTVYLETIPNLTFYFYSYRSQPNPIEIKDHDLFVRGEEGWMPYILRKTLAAIHHCVSNLANEPFDYLIRSNISTVVNYKQFPYEELIGKHYATTWAFTLNWLNPGSGITDERLFGLRFASGTNIILSREAARYISENRLQADETVQDDVAIGELLSHSPYPLYQLRNTMKFASDSPPMGFTYRHKSSDRKHDATLMKKLLLAIV